MTNYGHCDHSAPAVIYTYGEVLVPNGIICNGAMMVVPEERTSFATPAVAGLACLALEYVNKEKDKERRWTGESIARPAATDANGINMTTKSSIFREQKHISLLQTTNDLFFKNHFQNAY